MACFIWNQYKNTYSTNSQAFWENTVLNFEKNLEKFHK